MNKVSKAVLCKMYLDDYMPMHVIAKELGVSIGTVYNYCHKYGIQTRDKKSTFTFSGRKHSKEALTKISNANLHRKRSDITKQSISESKKMGGIGHKKKRADGYTTVYFPDHPCSTSDGYIMEHDLVMECIIGRHLYQNEVVHHINGIKSDNRKENLRLMTASEHMSLHMKERHKNRRENKNI